jgi:hypothetical protein
VTEQLDQRRDEPRPAGLVRGAQSGAVVAVEVLVEQDEVAPVRVGLELLRAAVDRAAPVAIDEERGDQTAGQFAGNLGQRHSLPRPGGALDRELVAVVAVVLQ